ncbi:MAG: hypothetical protein AVDCRST_MAG19-4017, partial [uncultured Thermomicrobiales bacterium]
GTVAQAEPMRTACRLDRQSGGCRSSRRSEMAGSGPDSRRTHASPDRAL